MRRFAVALMLALCLASCDTLEEPEPFELRVSGFTVDEGPSRATFRRATMPALTALTLVRGGYVLTVVIPEPLSVRSYCVGQDPRCAKPEAEVVYVQHEPLPTSYPVFSGSVTLTQVSAAKIAGRFSFRIAAQTAPVLIDGRFEAGPEVQAP